MQIDITLLPQKGFGPDGQNPRRHPRTPAYREENFAVPEISWFFENTARKGLPKVRWGSNKTSEGFWERVVHHEVLNSTFGKVRLCVSFLDQFKLIF